MFSCSQRGDSNEYTQYTISQFKKDNHPKLSQICNNGVWSKGLKTKLETAMVNEPSVFESLKFYCTYMHILVATPLSDMVHELPRRWILIAFLFTLDPEEEDILYAIGWLIGCLGFNGLLRQYFSLYQAVSKRGEERRRNDR